MTLSPQGRRYLIIALGAIWATIKQRIGVETQHAHAVHGLMGLAMLLDGMPEIKALFSKAPEVPKTVTTALLPIIFLLGISGCSLTPQQVQSDTAIGTQLLLDGAVKLDPKEQPRIDTDARTLAGAIRDQVGPMFSPTANAGTVASGAINQTMTLLHNKLAASSTGTKVTEVVDLLEGPFASLLSSTKSPTSLMPITEQMQTLAFFYGVQLGISRHLNDPTLAPPPLPAVPTTPPAPAPAPPSTPAPTPGSTPPK